jgi:hypothetical protein
MPAPEAITHLILHITAAPWGTVESIRQFHIAPPPHGRGWQDIGYAYVLTNPFPTFETWKNKTPIPSHDGQVHLGRDLDHDGDVDEEVGAHALGWNSRSIGIALVGENGMVTGLQVKHAAGLCRDLAHRFEVPYANVIGHYETGANKTCPDIEMDHFRKLLIDAS